MSILILHLSDIHIKNASDPILKRSASIAASVNPYLHSLTHLFLVVSGDIAFAGTNNQFVLAKTFLLEIKENIQKETDVPISFIIAPGNHDCDFSQNTGARKILVKSIQSSITPEIDSSVIDSCTSIQKSFFNFRNELEADSDINDDMLWRSRRFVIDGKVVEFDCLNISWMSELHESPGNIYFPSDQYQEKSNDTVHVRFVVLHHPINWFNQSIYRTFRSFVRRLADIVISGHEHQGNVGIIEEAESDISAFVEGCVLYDEDHPASSSFNIIQIDINKSQFATIRHELSGSHYVASKEGAWSEYRNLPVKTTNPFPISEAFQEIMDDPGAFFKHPGANHANNITLSDIFIFPDLRKIGNGESKRRNLINSSKLLDPDFIADGVLIEGDEKAGCTSLVYQIFRYYHGHGYVPLLISGKNIKKSIDRDLDDIIAKSVTEQYSKAHISAYQQLSTSKKLLLLDDFDDGPLKAADIRASLLCSVKKRFGYLIVTVNEMFEMREMLDGDASRSLISLQHYKLQPFGYLLRSQLIQRWFLLGSDGTHDEASFIAKCDQAERLMKTIMTKTVIPKIPLYLLTLLQSLEAGRSSDFKDSSLGYYYQYLLTHSFKQAGVKPDKLTELFQYTSHLAWEYHVQNKHELSEIDLRDFNTRFSDKWHTVDFTVRIDILIRARVLHRIGEDYAFRYPYIYYYLKGLYISKHLHDVVIRDYISGCCKHLYVRDHANTVLFLAHHTNDDILLDSISEALNSIFKACTPVTFEGDITSVQKLIDEAPKLIYTGEQPAEYRKRHHEAQDELDDEKDGLADSEETSDDLSLIAQIIMLFKTTEILGQILKNQYSEILRSRKIELIDELFKGPLRALRDFYNFIDKNPDALIAEIEAALQKKGKVTKEEDRKKIAKKVVSRIVQIVSFAFIFKAAQGANSDDLVEEVRSVVIKEDNLSFKLIELFIHLDTPKAIPRQMLKSVYAEAKSNMVAKRLIQIMVLNRLYMFKTTEKDMQWLSSEIDLNIDMQHTITYQENKLKLLK